MTDPSKTVRTKFIREFLNLVKNARGKALDELRPLLKQRDIDIAQIIRILTILNAAYLIQPATQILPEYIKQAYEHGITNTHDILTTQIKPHDIALDIGIGINFTRPDERAIANLSAVSLSDLQGFTAEMSKKIIRDIVEADKKGAGITKFTQIIQDHYSGIGASRAETIARTVTSQAYNQATFARALEYAPYKGWSSTTTDSRTRASHRAMNRFVVEVDEPFDVPAFMASKNTRVEACQMMFPSDSSLGASPGQIINCRCSLVPKFVKKQ
jgi:uncharacterized protein with gpF-like domain